MARGLRCLFGVHDWARRQDGDRTYLVCTRCGRESDGPGAVLNPPSAQ